MQIQFKYMLLWDGEKNGVFFCLCFVLLLLCVFVQLLALHNSTEKPASNAKSIQSCDMSRSSADEYTNPGEQEAGVIQQKGI